MSDRVNKYALLGAESVLYEYEGKVNKEVLLDILPIIEGILDSLGVNLQKKRKIVNIAIEVLQNLQLHAFPIGENAYDLEPMFLVAKNENNIAITIGNLIHNSEQDILKGKLNKINSLNDEEIKFLYGVIMKQTVVKFSTKGGAGLGLIDMKKKSGNPLTFSFQKVDDSVSYFSLKISVSE
jgi:hypothetical protein